MLFLLKMSGVLKVYLILFWVSMVFFRGLCYFFSEDARCAEDIPDTILGWFGVFRACVKFS